MKNYFEDVNKKLNKRRFEKYYDALSVVQLRDKELNEALAIVQVFSKEYVDADAGSKQLYIDFAQVFTLKYVKEHSRNRLRCELGVEGKHIFLSTDYIGPSRTKAFSAGLNGGEIYDMIMESRTLGGHMAWPVYGKSGTMTINQAKGLCYGDRIDLTLYAIKLWYNDSIGSVSKRMRNTLNYFVTSEWLKSFGDGERGFKKFINDFGLNPFVNDKYDVYDLTSFDNEFDSVLSNDSNRVLVNKDEFLKYMNGNLYCIRKRNKLIKGFKAI